MNSSIPTLSQLTRLLVADYNNKQDGQVMYEKAPSAYLQTLFEVQSFLDTGYVVPEINSGILYLSERTNESPDEMLYTVYLEFNPPSFQAILIDLIYPYL